MDKLNDERRDFERERAFMLRHPGVLNGGGMNRLRYRLAFALLVPVCFVGAICCIVSFSLYDWIYRAKK